MGFQRAFVRFWKERPDNTRSEEELLEASKSLLRGCKQHFEASLTRIKRMIAVVGIDGGPKFSQLVKGLLLADSVDDFQQRCKIILREFPNCKNWLQWWMRPEHARMLFVNTLDPIPPILKEIPESTNAQEAMHFSMYSQCGKHHDTLQGLELCLKYANGAQQTYTNKLGRSMFIVSSRNLPHTF